MEHILEWSKYYSEGDIVLIEYWYNDMITPVKLLEKVGRKYRVSHNCEQSKIPNAPDEIIKSGDIIDHHRPKKSN
jgi:hypothetical protein